MAKLRELSLIADADIMGYCAEFYREHIELTVVDNGKAILGRAVLREAEFSRECRLTGHRREEWLELFESINIKNWASHYGNTALEIETVPNAIWHLECIFDDGRHTASMGNDDFPGEWKNLSAMLEVFLPEIGDMDEVEDEEDEEDLLYAMVLFKDTDYFDAYLVPKEMGEPEEGGFCIVPAGPEDAETIGMIYNVDYFEREDASDSPEKMKSIIRLIDPPEDAELYIMDEEDFD